jgi:small subunit ribosomal protein S4
MGDPKFAKKKYKTPGHPWEANRIKEEFDLVKEYGLKNKKELWRMGANLRNWQEQARATAALSGEQKDKVESTLVGKISKLGILTKGARIDDVLSLTIRDVLERRLQTQLYKQGMAFTPKQARQFIVHNKIEVNKVRVNAPSYLVKVTDKLSFISDFTIKLVKPKKVEEPKVEQVEAKVSNG